MTFSLAMATDVFRESVIVAVTDTSGRGLETCFAQTFGIPDRHVLNPAI